MFYISLVGRRDEVIDGIVAYQEPVDAAVGPDVRLPYLRQYLASLLGTYQEGDGIDLMVQSTGPKDLNITINVRPLAPRRAVVITPADSR